MTLIEIRHDIIHIILKTKTVFLGAVALVMLQTTIQTLLTEFVLFLYYIFYFYIKIYSS